MHTDQSLENDINIETQLLKYTFYRYIVVYPKK